MSKSYWRDKVETDKKGTEDLDSHQWSLAILIFLLHDKWECSISLFNGHVKTLCTKNYTINAGKGAQNHSVQKPIHPVTCFWEVKFLAFDFCVFVFPIQCFFLKHTQKYQTNPMCILFLFGRTTIAKQNRFIYFRDLHTDHISKKQTTRTTKLL